MGKVHILPKQVSQLIAAGEVVERPASIIKELVENAIDAQATAIIVEIKNGGISYIRVTDNGSGIEKEDMKTIFLRHATSKITKEEDLDHIATLGFRGEALASIAAVSKIEVISKTEGEDFAYSFSLIGGEEGEIEETGAPDGTTFIVKDLFFNTPARMKFLKKDTTEGNAIVSIVQKIALSHPEISFKVIRDDKEVLHTPGDHQLLSVIRSVFNKKANDEMLFVEYKQGPISVSGYVSKPLHARANRAMEHFFINNRYVKTQTASIATEQAYKGLMMVGKFPSCALNITIPYDMVDINVHPAKTEVRFHNEREVFSVIYAAVKSTLMEYSTKSEAKFEFKTPEKKTKENIFAIGSEETKKELEQESFGVFAQTNLGKKSDNKKEDKKNNIDFSSRMNSLTSEGALQDDEEPFISLPRQKDRTAQPIFQENSASQIARAMREGGVALKEKPMAYEGTSDQVKTEVFASSNEKVQFAYETNDTQKRETETSPTVIPDFRVVGEIFSTYILLEQEGKLFFVDKHASHERIVYEKLMRERRNPQVQLLMSPVFVELSMEEYTAVIDHLRLLKEAGFLVEDFGQGTVVIREVPSVVEKYDIKDIFLEITQNLVDNLKKVTFEKLEWLYQSVACRAAIKGGDKSTILELEELVKDIYRFDLIRYCPHGRPIMVQVSKKDIEDHFGR